MDSLTQLTLGAAVGQAVLGHRLGRKAALIGAIAGTMPDLDALFLSHLDVIARMSAHRGFSHSLLFCLLAPLPLSWLCRTIHTKMHQHGKKTRTLAATAIGIHRWYLFWCLAFLTHTILDCFTSWGTQLFWPHPYRVALHSIFIIDPFYTIPLLIGVMASLYTKTRRPVCLALLISSLYLLSTLAVQHHVKQQVEKAISADAGNVIVRPTPFNALIWTATAHKDGIFLSTHYSLLDKEPPKNIQITPDNHSLIEPYKDRKQVKILLDFTQHFYSISEGANNTLIIHDERFGKMGGWDNGTSQYVFGYQFDPEKNTLTRISIQHGNIRQLLKRLWKRI